MARKWMRTIDSAQREVAVDRPRGPETDHINRVVFHIQGITLETTTGKVFEDWPNMAEEGVRHKGQSPLSIWDRLLRREAIAGSMETSDGLLRVTFWMRPELTLEFDLTDQDQVNLWRECEIMTLSAGYHFRQQDDHSHEYKIGAF